MYFIDGLIAANIVRHQHTTKLDAACSRTANQQDQITFLKLFFTVALPGQLASVL